MNYVFLDLETTGLYADEHFITEVAAVKTDEHGEILAEAQSYVLLPEGEEVPAHITELTGITDAMLAEKGAPVSEVMLDLQAFIGDAIVVAHFAPFDLSFVERHFKVKNFMDTRSMVYTVRPLDAASLKNLTDFYGITLENHHSALYDARALKEVFFRLKSDLAESTDLLLNAVGSRRDRLVNYYPSSTTMVFNVFSDGRLHVVPGGSDHLPYVGELQPRKGGDDDSNSPDDPQRRRPEFWRESRG